MVRTILGLVVVCCVVAMTENADAAWRVFRRSSATCANGTCNVPQKAVQQPAVRVSVGVQVGETSSAQGVANIMARLGRVGHFGGHRWFEGCGMAATPQGAYSVCCYANSGMVTYDVGYARGANGMWYCCRRYRP